MRNTQQTTTTGNGIQKVTVDLDAPAPSARQKRTPSFRRLFGNTSALVSGPSLPGDSSVDNITRVSNTLNTLVK
jgi:hypothetical protein